MNKRLNLLIIAVVSLVAIHFGSCEYYEIDHKSGSYTSIDILKELNENKDSYGNLVLTNNTNYRYLLYVNDSLSRLIPANASNHLIYISTQGGRTFNLKLYKRTDILNNELLSPPASKVFLQWDVVLPKETWDNVRVSWVIDENQHSEEATVNFSYPSSNVGGEDNPYSVDIYLNSTTGAKFLSLPPGGTASSKISYGYQVLLFRYWRSNPASPGGQEEIGWVNLKPNGTVYGLVLNSFNEIVDFYVPAYFEVYPQVYGKVKFMNNTDNVLFIQANGQRFENFIILPEGSSTIGLSFVDEQSETSFYDIPIGDYIMKAIIPASGADYKTNNITITVESEYIWEID